MCRNSWQAEESADWEPSYPGIGRPGAALNPIVEVAGMRNVRDTAEANSEGAVGMPWEHLRGKLDSTRSGEPDHNRSA